jgi:hypothetical protein
VSTSSLLLLNGRVIQPCVPLSYQALAGHTNTPNASPLRRNFRSPKSPSFCVHPSIIVYLV